MTAAKTKSAAKPAEKAAEKPAAKQQQPAKAEPKKDSGGPSLVTCPVCQYEFEPGTPTL